MESVKWSKEETAVLVYFASRNANHEGCCQILGMRFGPDKHRSANAVRQKLSAIRDNNVELCRGKKGWDQTKVDEWLIALGISDLDALLEVRSQELDKVAPVRYRLPFVQYLINKNC